MNQPGCETFWQDQGLPPRAMQELAKVMGPQFLAWRQARQLSPQLDPFFERLYLPLAAWLAKRQAQKGACLLVGVNGGQGTGKSTLCQALEQILAGAFGVKAVSLSLDDFYLSHQERQKLAQKIHPLLATRGVPGTHHHQRGRDCLLALAQLKKGHSLALPRFNKAMDDPFPPSAWPQVEGPLDLVFLEGWFVGAKPQEPAELEPPINALEAEQDPQGHWRGYANQMLAEYQPWFAPLEVLIQLKAPNFEAVLTWRQEQEEHLARLLAQTPDPNRRLMSPAEIRHFVQHYQRLTLHQLAHLPAQAHLLVELNQQHGLERLSCPRPL